MYIYTLLSILALPLVVDCETWWDLLEDIFINGSEESEDARLNISQLAHKYGYEIEEHHVVTEDLYKITFHRIPKENRPVVFLMHGITESSDSWLLQGPSSLGFVLATAGFDVWLGNARGNRYSTEHPFWNYTSPEFWDFSWEEIGLYDLPAMIDYILNATKRESLYYIGHSQGTTCGYVLLSMKPEYNDRIQLMFSLAPEAWMANVRSKVIKLLSSAVNQLIPFFEYGIFTSGSELFQKITTSICSWLPENCKKVLYDLMGPENKIKDSLWSVIFGHMPTGSSAMEFVHYGQLVNSGRFCRFDYGTVGNIKVYGRTKPPDYDLKNVVAPVILYYSDNDWLSDPNDVVTLMEHLPNVIDGVFVPAFGHMDYVYAAEALDTIYKKIVGQIKSFENQ